MSTEDPDDGRTRAYTVRLELVDEPGELLTALEPIADRGGNLLSIHHERGAVTPRGRIPVEVDFECLPARFDRIVEALGEAGVSVVRAGRERHGITVLLVGDVAADLSETLDRLEATTGATVTDLALSAPEGVDGEASARVGLATETDRAADVLEAVRTIADRRGLSVVEPLVGGGA